MPVTLSILLSLFVAFPAAAQMPNAGDEPPATDPPPLAAPAAPTSPRQSSPALPGIEVQVGFISGPVNHPQVNDLRATYGGEVTFQSDQADGDLKVQRYTLRGHVLLHETDTTLRAGEVTFDGAAQSAAATQALLNREVFTLRSARLEGEFVRGATPEKDSELLTATEGDFTTTPPDEKADYHIHAQSITLDTQTHHGVLRNATLYLFGTRLLTIPRITFRAGGGGSASRRQGTFPTIGVSARYGTYLAFGSSLHVAHQPVQYRLLLPTRQSVQATVTSQQTLYAPRVSTAQVTSPSGPLTLLDRIRLLATAPTPVLPDGDPLRFHDILPEPNPIRLFDTPSYGGLGLNEELSVHVAARGRLRDDLYVSRLPEVTLRGQVPLTRPPAPPLYGDAGAFRDALRRLIFYADAQETVGDYREQLSTDPYSIRARRTRTQVGFSAYPVLIASNTVIQPRLLISTSSYSGRKTSYHYDQLDVAVNHYFSDLTAVGVQFLASDTGGDSPFNFDVLDTSRELDVRLQLGSRHLITAGRLRYDLARNDVIDYQLAVAPALHGLIPVFSYNFRTRSVGVGVEVKGVTF